MTLDKTRQYVYRIGSDNQYRLHWSDGQWCYEFLAGGVLFDEQKFPSESGIIDALSSHGMSLDLFQIDEDQAASTYSDQIKKKMQALLDAGVSPCPKHGLSAKNLDGICDACQNQDYPDDMKGTEG